MITIYFEITKSIVAIYHSSHIEVIGDSSIVNVYNYFIMIEDSWCGETYMQYRRVAA